MFISTIKNSHLVILGIIALVCLVYVPVVIFLFYLLLMSLIFSKKYKLMCFVIIAFLAFYNATKNLDGDWVWYVEHFRSMPSIGYIEYITSGMQSVRYTEPVYYFFAYIISYVSGGSALLLVFFITFVIYGIYAIGLVNLFKYLELKRNNYGIVIIFAFLFCVTFTQSAHLVRQYIAGSLLFLFFSMLVHKRYKYSLFVFIIGILVHNTIVIPFSMLLMAFFISKKVNLESSLGLFKVTFVAFFVGYMLSLIVGNFVLSSEGMLASAMLEDGDISRIVILQDSILYVALFFLPYHYRKHLSEKCRGLFALVFIFISIYIAMIIGVREYPLIYLRLYFYIEWFRVLALIPVLMLVNSRDRVFISVLLLFFSIVNFIMRLDRAPWDYSGGIFDHFFGDMFWWINNFII